jgi:very-short-patch-repair endonuclease
MYEDWIEQSLNRQARPAIARLFESAHGQLHRAASRSCASNLWHALTYADKECESEIEKYFLLAWATKLHEAIVAPMWLGWNAAYELVERDRREIMTSYAMSKTRDVMAPPGVDTGPSQYDYVFSQFPIGNYRADFMLVRWAVTYNMDDDPSNMHRIALRLPAVVVECDGHEFHEKTKEQAQRDKARDRFFQAEGYHVLRFTGSELYRDALACAEEVSKFFDQHNRTEEGREWRR